MADAEIRKEQERERGFRDFIYHAVCVILVIVTALETVNALPRVVFYTDGWWKHFLAVWALWATTSAWIYQ